MKELAARVTVDIPESLVERELDRRTEEFARRLMDQNIDPRRRTSTGISSATASARRAASR